VPETWPNSAQSQDVAGPEHSHSDCSCLETLQSGLPVLHCHGPRCGDVFQSQDSGFTAASRFGNEPRVLIIFRSTCSATPTHGSWDKLQPTSRQTHSAVVRPLRPCWRGTSVVSPRPPACTVFTKHSFREARSRCTMHNCTCTFRRHRLDRFGEAPCSPSIHAMNRSARPRFFSSVSTGGQNFAPSACPPSTPGRLFYCLKG
jgi:hypothetical protein